MGKKGTRPEHIMLKAQSTWNGGIYIISQKEYTDNAADWKVLTIEEEAALKGVETMPEGIVVEEADMEVPTEIEEMSYFEIKDMLDSLGIEYKGNAKKAELIELLAKGAD